MRYTALLMILMFFTVAVDAESTAEQRFFDEVIESGVNFVLVDDHLTLVKTDETAEAVDALVAKKPTGTEVTVITYKNTGNRQPGWKLEE